VGDARGLGLLWAVEFVADKLTKQPYPAEKRFSARVNESALRCGVMVYPMQGCVDGKRGDHVMIAPPAVIAADEIQWAVEQLSEAIREAEAP
jgi:adenosylmethionine-8-amino-7-oxononanoate aminotransferase